jgi:hypothetical protein
VNMAHGEMVEKELDTMMVRRAKKGEKTQARGSVKGSTRRQTGKHILHMWEEGTKHREEETRSLIDTIGRTRVEQEADKA